MTAKLKTRLRLAGVVAAVYMTLAYVFWLPPIGMIYDGASLWTCHSSLKLIELQKMIWAEETGAKLGDEMSEADIQAAFAGQMPRCPAHGVYSVNKLGEPPACSLKENPPTPRKKLVSVFWWRWEVMPAGPHEYLSYDSNYFHQAYQ